MTDLVSSVHSVTIFILVPESCIGIPIREHMHTQKKRYLSKITVTVRQSNILNIFCKKELRLPMNLSDVKKGVIFMF